MPYNPSKFLSTAMYTISAGPSRKEFPIHSGLLCANSDALRRLIDAKKDDHTIDWTRWDEATVDRYVQWQYTREYSVPEPKPASMRQLRSDTRRPRGSSMPASPPATPSPPSSVLSGEGDNTPNPTPTIQMNDSDSMDYGEAFMAHARLYALAQATATSQLVVVCIHQLASLLDQIRWLERCSVAADNFVDLARFVYRHTSGHATREESLRRVISSFAAFNFERLDCPSMIALMAEGGDFVIDVSRKVMKTMRKPALATAPQKEDAPIALKAKARPVMAAPPPRAATPCTPSASSTYSTSSASSTSSVPSTPQSKMRRAPSVMGMASMPPPPSSARRTGTGLSAKSALDAIKASPGLDRKSSIARLSSPAVEAMRRSGLERKASTPRLAASTSALNRQSSHARLSFGK